MSEKVFILNLREAFEHRITRRAARAIKEIKKQIKRFTKAEQVKISQALNNFVYARGFKNAPRKVKVKVIVEDGVAKTYLFDEELKEKKEVKKEQKEEKKEIKEQKEKKPAKKENKEEKKGSSKKEVKKKDEKKA